MYDVSQPQSNWTNEELTAFNIEICEVSEQEFFGRSLSDTNRLPNDACAIAFAIIGRTDYFMQHNVDEEKCFDNIAINLHVKRCSETSDIIVRTREKLWLSMSRELLAIKTDTYISDVNSNILLVLLDGTLPRETPSDPEAHLVAASIAAFQSNNEKRRNASFQEALAAETIPGIIVVGGAPTFYKTLVSNTLDMAVQMGELPSQKTVVYKYCPIKPVYPDALGEEQREKILLALKAFSPFVLQTTRTTQGVDPKDVMGSTSL